MIKIGIYLKTDEAINPQVVADDIASLITMPHKERPLRTVSGLDYGLRDLNTSAESVQCSLLETLSMSGMAPTL